MRKIIFVFICVIISAVSVSAQEGTKPPVYKDIPDKSYSGFPMGFPGILELLNVEDEDIEKAIEIHREAAETIEIAKNKQAILKTKLKYDLMDPQVDMEEVEQLLRDTLEWELKIQMAQIERDLELRNLFGDDIWARMNIVNRSFFSNLNVDEKVKSFSEALRIMKDYPPEVQKKFLEQLERVYIRKSEELIRLETVLNKLRLLMTKSIRS
ncbi:MAG: hypothetical protein ACLFST_00110 [Spirochaetia bacterium]